MMHRVPRIAIEIVLVAGVAMSASALAANGNDPLLSMSKDELNKEMWGGDACAEWLLQADSIHGEVQTAKGGTRSDEQIRDELRELSLQGEAPSSAGYKMTEFLIENAADGMGKADLRSGVLEICRRYAPEDVQLEGAWQPNPTVRE
ncbi:hypothetical protein [Arhodomonas sp. AD133]|uniref:hypothetical protein n=1 Tax=Arhodomonas sp. AD133 TaxID=3415009 RepID=UPI003EBF8754